MNRIFFRIVPLVMLAIAVAAVAIYFAIRYAFGDPLEEIARRQASGPIFLLEQYIDQAPADEWLVRLNKVREVSGFSLELVPLATALTMLDTGKHEALQRGELVLDIANRSFFRRVDLAGDRYIGSDEEVLQVRDLPIDVGLEMKMDAIRYAIVALFVLLLVGIWSRTHWLELLSLSKVATGFGEGKLSVRASTAQTSAIYPLAQCMNQMADRIEALLDAHRSLLHSASHELRTPISRLEFGLELLRSASDQDAEKRIQAMENDVRELNALVNELLDLAKLEQPHSLQVSMFSLAHALHECVSRIEHAIAGRQLTCHFSDGLGDISADRRLLVRAIGNLLINATKYADRHISLSATKLQNDTVEIIVDDDGPGIPVEERERIFAPFHRLDRSRDRATGGFGLGLAIAQKAVLLHGGQIAAKRSPLGGARFVVRIPV